MQYSVGQNVVHPTHGTGEIVDITDEELVEGFKNYYVVEFATKKLTLRVPVRKTDDVGMRRVMTKSRLNRVLNRLQDISGQLPKHFRKRRQKVEEMIQSGRPGQIAEAVGELTWRKKEAKLNQTEKQLLSKGKEMLVTEIAMVTDSKIAEAKKRINKVLAEAVKAKRAEQADGEPALAS